MQNRHYELGGQCFLIAVDGRRRYTIPQEFFDSIIILGIRDPHPLGVFTEVSGTKHILRFETFGNVSVPPQLAPASNIIDALGNRH